MKKAALKDCFVLYSIILINQNLSIEAIIIMMTAQIGMLKF